MPGPYADTKLVLNSWVYICTEFLFCFFHFFFKAWVYFFEYFKWARQFQIFFPENMKKPTSKVAHNQPISHIYFHKIGSLRDFNIMTLSLIIPFTVNWSKMFQKNNIARSKYAPRIKFNIPARAFGLIVLSLILSHSEMKLRI